MNQPGDLKKILTSPDYVRWALSCVLYAFVWREVGWATFTTLLFMGMNLETITILDRVRHAR